MNLPNYIKVSTPNNTDINLEPIFNDDVVEVVRCKNCKYRSAMINENSGTVAYLVCNHDDGCVTCTDDGYCSYGER